MAQGAGLAPRRGRAGRRGADRARPGRAAPRLSAAPGAGPACRRRGRHLRDRRCGPLRGRHRHGQEPRVPAAGGLRQRRRRPSHRRQHQDQGPAAPARRARAASRGRRATAGLALGAADGPRELRLPAATGRSRGGRVRVAARCRPLSRARLPRGAGAPRRGRPLGTAVPCLPRAAGAGRSGSRAALLTGHVPRPALPLARRLSLASGPRSRRGGAPRVRQPRPVAHRPRDAAAVRRRGDRRGAPAVRRSHRGVQPGDRRSCCGVTARGPAGPPAPARAAAAPAGGRAARRARQRPVRSRPRPTRASGPRNCCPTS